MGELSDVSLPSLVGLFGLDARTGKLTVKADGQEVHLYLDAGRLVLVTSSDLTLRLGRMLIRRGLLTSQQLLDALHEQANAPEQDGRSLPLGRILVARGWVTDGELARCVEEQCIEVLARVLAARDGVFLYVGGVTAPANLAIVSLDADHVLAEATRRTDELRALRGLLPTPTAPLLVTPWIAEEMGTLSEPEEQVAKVLRGGAGSLAELAEQLPLDEITLGRTVLALRDRGLLIAGTEAGDRRVS